MILQFLLQLSPDLTKIVDDVRPVDSGCVRVVCNAQTKATLENELLSARSEPTAPTDLIVR